MARQTWFITGINSGIGRHLTEQLLERGDRVAGTARRLDQLNDLSKRYPDTLWLSYLDVTDTAVIRKVVAEAFTAFGRIDFVVNNAGYGLFGAAEELTDDQIIHELNTNTVGSIQVVRAALPYLRKQGGGRIIQISTMGGQIALPGLSLYHASKWAIEGFFESTAQDIAPFNIQTTLVEPGGAKTNFAFSSAVVSPALEVYADTPAGAVRKIVTEGTRIPPGDPVKMAAAIIASADQKKAPKRLVLGSDAYTLIEKALKERLAELESQKDIAFSTDFPPDAAA